MNGSMSFLNRLRVRGPEQDVGKLESVHAMKKNGEGTDKDEVKVRLGWFTQEVKTICTERVFFGAAFRGGLDHQGT
jgi:hypothetical protein